MTKCICQDCCFDNDFFANVMSNDILKINNILNLKPKNYILNIKNHDNDSPLIIACKVNENDMIELLIDYGFDVNVSDNYIGLNPTMKTLSNTPLIWSIFHNNIEVVKLLIENNVNLNDIDTEPLIYAIKSLHIPMIELILNNGVDVNLCFNKSKYALNFAIQRYLSFGNEYMPIIELLINNGAELNNADTNGRTILMDTDIIINTELMELLLLNGANPNCRDNNNTSVLMYAIEYQSTIDIISLLIKYDVNLNTNVNNISIIKFIIVLVSKIKNKNDVVYKNDIEYNYYLNITEFLLKNNTNPDIISTYTLRTPIFLAIYYCLIDFVNIFIQYNVDVNHIDTVGYSPLLYCICLNDMHKDDYYEIAKILLNNGCDPNIMNSDHDPIIFELIKYNNFVMTELLLKYEYDTNVITDDYSTCLFDPVCDKKYKMVELLLKYGANINHQNIYGNTPIVYALNDIKMCMILLDSTYEDLNITNFNSESIFDIIKSMNHDTYKHIKTKLIFKSKRKRITYISILKTKLYDDLPWQKYASKIGYLTYYELTNLEMIAKGCNINTDNLTKRELCYRLTLFTEENISKINSIVIPKDLIEERKRDCLGATETPIHNHDFSTIPPDFLVITKNHHGYSIDEIDCIYNVHKDNSVDPQTRESWNKLTILNDDYTNGREEDKKYI